MSSGLQIIERNTKCVDIVIRQRANIASYVLGAALSLDAAQAGTAAMITVRSGGDYRSRTLRRNKINRTEDIGRGFTRISYDPTDFASVTVPGDEQIAFLRLTEVDHSGASLPEGPILVLPPTSTWYTNSPTIVLNGTAPNVAGLANNLPPPTAMWINFPRTVRNLSIHNDGAVPLAIALGPAGTQEFEIPVGGDEVPWFELALDVLSVRGVGGTAAFRLVASSSNGPLI